MYAEDLPLLETDPGRITCTSLRYRINGYDLGGGSISNFRTVCSREDVRSFRFSEQSAREQFGFLMDFRIGTPPHGGIAIGSRPFNDATGRSEQIYGVRLPFQKRQAEPIR